MKSLALVSFIIIFGLAFLNFMPSNENGIEENHNHTESLIIKQDKPDPI